MAETMRINLTKTAVFIGIIATLASVLGGGAIAYDNAKIAKQVSSKNRADIAGIKTKQARFEGIIDERTKNTAKRVDDIYAIVKDWTPDGKD